MPTEDMEMFDPLAEDSGFEWEPVEGSPGIQKMVFYMDDDGSHTRLLKLEPGTETEEFVHDFYEELWVLEGGLIDTRLDEVFTEGMYACRTPGMEHGPYIAPIGCLSFEHRYYK